MQAFVAEQYLPAGSAEAVVLGAGAARSAAEELARDGVAVQFLQSLFVPEDETCMHLYLADSVETVRAAATRAALRPDRIAEALSCAGCPEAEEER